MEIQSRGPSAHHVRSHDAELFEGAGSARLDDHVGRSGRDGQARTRSLASWKSRATDRFAPLRRSKKDAGPRRAPSGREVDSTLITFAPARARRSPQSGPAHSEERSITRRPSGPERSGASPRRVAMMPGAVTSPSRATGSPSSTARSSNAGLVASGERISDRRPGGGLGRRCRRKLQPGRHQIAILGAGQGDRDPARRARQQVTAATIARRTPAPQAHQCGPFAQEGRCIEVWERRRQLVDGLPTGRTAVRAGAPTTR